MKLNILLCLALTSSALLAQGVRLFDLPVSTDPSTNTYFLLSDRDLPTAQSSRIINIVTLKNAIAELVQLGVIPDGDRGDIVVSGDGLVWMLDSATLRALGTNSIVGTGRIVLESDIGEGSGDFMADGSVPMVGNLNLGGYAITNGQVAISLIQATGTPSSTTYLRGDGTWATPPAGGTGDPDAWLADDRARTADLDMGGQSITNAAAVGYESVSAATAAFGDLDVTGQAYFDLFQTSSLIVTNSIELLSGGAYGDEWEDSMEVPTKGSVYSAIRSVSSGGSGSAADVSFTFVTSDGTTNNVLTNVIATGTALLYEYTLLGSGATNSGAYKLAGLAHNRSDGMQLDNDAVYGFETPEASLMSAGVSTHASGIVVFVSGMAGQNINWKLHGIYHTVNSGELSPEEPGGTPETLLTGLVEGWKLEETSGTRYGVSNTFNLSPTATIDYDSGIIGNAAKFTGGGAYLRTADHDDLSIDDATFTAWVNLTSTNAASTILSKVLETSGGNEYDLMYSAAMGTFRWLVSTNSNSFALVTADTVPNLDEWTFVVAQANTTNSTIRIKTGTEASGLSSWSTATIPSWTGVNTDTMFSIGRRSKSGAGGQSATALIDEVYYWNRVLTDDEVLALFNSGAPASHPWE